MNALYLQRVVLRSLTFLSLTTLASLTWAQEVSSITSLKDNQYQADIQDAYHRIDPKNDGWDSEVRGNQYGTQLNKFVEKLLHGEALSSLTEGFQGHQIRPSLLNIIFENAGMTIRRGNPDKDFKSIEQLHYNSSKKLKSKIKIIRIEPNTCEALVTFKASGFQVNTSWRCQWTDASPPKLRSLEVLEYEEVEQMGTPLLSEITEAVLGDTAAYREQLLHSTDFWRLRIPRDFGLDPAANHGLALADVNGDGLEDLYLCQQGGIPNRLFLQNKDGTMRDFSEESGTDWMDFCAGALLLDLDNDGDKDLVVSQDFRILFMENDGAGHFELVFGSSTKAQSFSLSAADFDLDGFVDVYICGYNPSFSEARAGALGEPIPFHDANNGGKNILWRNLGNWNFEDVTQQTGLDNDNTRFSFAASWEDYDQDGDLDLYVANDFGRNCLYQNQGTQEGKLPRFVNIAPELGIEDSSAGMSVSWGDFNRDGWSDLYVSNMFSSAGNRITYQKQFKTGTDQKTLETFQRMARGNTLFASNQKGGFSDVTLSSNTSMARWCWASTFADLNNDGWLDILAANGFITSEDTGDL